MKQYQGKLQLKRIIRIKGICDTGFHRWIVSMGLLLCLIAIICLGYVPAAGAGDVIVNEDCYQTLMASAHAREIPQLTLLNTHRISDEILYNIYMYRSVQAVYNPPPGVAAETFLDRAITLADFLVAERYRENCYDGTSDCIKIGGRFVFPRIIVPIDPNGGYQMDISASATIALLDLALLLIETGDAFNEDKAISYYIPGVRLTLVANKRYHHTQPLDGRGSCSGFGGAGGIKWNYSNRWAVANYLIYHVKNTYPSFPVTVGAIEPYHDLAVEAARCFKLDLQTGSRYQCYGGSCYDSIYGPFWSAWHSATTGYHRIPDDPSHANQTLKLLFYAFRYNWIDEDGVGLFDEYDLTQFRNYFFFRSRAVGPGTEPGDLWAFQRTWGRSLTYSRSCVPYPGGPLEVCQQVADDPTTISSMAGILAFVGTGYDWYWFNKAWPTAGLDNCDVTESGNGQHVLSRALELYWHLGTPY